MKHPLPPMCRLRGGRYGEAGKKARKYPAVVHLLQRCAALNKNSRSTALWSGPPPPVGYKPPAWISRRSSKEPRPVHAKQESATCAYATSPDTTAARRGPA